VFKAHRLLYHSTLPHLLGSEIGVARVARQRELDRVRLLSCFVPFRSFRF